jgi:hypothetical protein
MTPGGPVLFVLGSGDGAAPQVAPAGMAVAAAGYYKTCWVRVSDPTIQLWWLKLSSTFWYNYSTLTQQQPILSSLGRLGYSWSNKSAWNTYWSPTVRFADGQGDLNFTLIFQRTYHLYIQEDAWGNCTGGWY